MKIHWKKLWITLGLLLLFFVEAGFSQTWGILNQVAPSWEVTRWMHLEEGKKILDISDFKGKVVYLYCFQNW